MGKSECFAVSENYSYIGGSRGIRVLCVNWSISHPRHAYKLHYINFSSQYIAYVLLNGTQSC